jgi:hypothetical protein
LLQAVLFAISLESRKDKIDNIFTRRDGENCPPGRKQQSTLQATMTYLS